MANEWQLHTHQVNAYCYYSGLFDDEMIDGIIETGDALKAEAAQVGGNITGPGTVNDTIRKTTIHWIPTVEENAWIFRKLTDIILQANQQWFGFDINNIENLQYSVYEEGDFYAAHVDHHFQGAGQYPRKLSKEDTQKAGFDSNKIMGYSLRTSKYRFTIWMNDFTSDQPFDAKKIFASEMYDYNADPLEKVNVYTSNNYKEAAKEMYSKMVNFFKSQESK
jgi:hypothetical protein